MQKSPSGHTLLPVKTPDYAADFRLLKRLIMPPIFAC
jgi:hypothetical protein